MASEHSAGYRTHMTAPGNLADPDFEPSDDDLTGLARRAFADVRRQHERALEKLRAQIASARADVLRRLAEAEKRT